MLKKIIVSVLWAASAAMAMAAVEVNTGSAAELDALPGVGPALSQRILDARKQGEFKDWPDLMTRVKGVKEKSAAKLSGAGLTVNGKPYSDGAAAPAKAMPPAAPAKAMPPAAPAAAMAPAAPAAKK